MAEIEVMTTMFQHPIRVDEAEAAVLRSQGLIVDAPPEDDVPAGDDKPEPKEPVK